MSLKASPPLKNTSSARKPLAPLMSASHKSQTEQGLHSSLRHCLTHLREENTQLVTQNHRLISELEDTSHQLLAANDKIGSLRGELVNSETSPEREKVVVLQAQMKSLQDKLKKNADLQVKLDQATSKQQKEKEEWAMRQRALQDQLSDIQEECSRLREACSLAEERAGERELAEGLPYLNRSLSSQSLTTYHPSLFHHPHSTPLKPDAHPVPPLINSTLLSHSLLNGSTTSLKSTQSAREPTTARPRGSYTSQHHTRSSRYHGQSTYPLKYASNGSTYLSKRKPGGEKHSSYSSSSYSQDSGFTPRHSSGSSGSGEGISLELKQAKAKIRQLEKEVLLLEQQLTDKTHSAQSHVEELTHLRTELAKERASLAIQQEEEQERAAVELGRVKALHAEQCRELQAQVERVMGEKAEREKEAAQLRGALKASHSEATSLSERVNNLMKQLEQERSSHSEAMQVLQVEVEGGNVRVTQLEHALDMCRSELEGHVSRVGEAVQLHKSEVEELKKQINMLSSGLSETQQQLSQKTDLATQLQRELTKTKMELQQGHDTWRKEEGELRQMLHQSEVIRQSLLQQVERGSHELAATSGKLIHHQRVTAELRQYQTEVAHLQRRVTELQQCKQDLEEKCVSGREERKGLMVEVGELKNRLEQSEKQREKTKVRCEELEAVRQKGGREEKRLREEVEKVRGELEGCRSELEAVAARSKQREGEVEGALSHMQQELAKRAQQVLEMDGLLRNHQADTAAHRLQLERTLAQRQGDLRARTQELEDITIKYTEAQKVVKELHGQVAQLQSAGQSISSEQHKQLQAKTSELASLRQKLKEAESLSMSRGKKEEEMRRKLVECEKREGELRERCGVLERKVQQLQRESDSKQEQHVNQVQHLQETHTTLLASLEQQASSHQLQLQQLTEQERVRQEELSRCRAQVASLSAELAAERQVGEETRRQVALSRAEAARYQAQVSSMQRALSVNNMANMANMTLHRAGSTSSLVGTNPTPPIHTPSLLPHHTSTLVSGPPSKGGSENPVAMETTLGSEMESEVEFAQLPIKLSTPSLPHIPTSTPFLPHIPTSTLSLPHIPTSTPSNIAGKNQQSGGRKTPGEIINI